MTAVVGYMFVFGLVVIAVIALLIVLGGKYAPQLSASSDAKTALLLTHSSAFWARWPYDRLAAAPYAELAAEAARCELMVAGLRAAMRPPRIGAKPPSVPGDYLHRRLVAYEGMLDAVRRTMAQSAPPRRPT